jgi:hypothetical protein
VWTSKIILFTPAFLNTTDYISRSAFKGPTRDDYIPPSAHYEMAVLVWVEGQANTPAETKEKIETCQSWLDKVAGWDAYLLDGRVGMRVQTGMDTLRWYKRENGLSTS